MNLFAHADQAHRYRCCCITLSFWQIFSLDESEIKPRVSARIIFSPWIVNRHAQSAARHSFRIRGISLSLSLSPLCCVYASCVTETLSGSPDFFGRFLCAFGWNQNHDSGIPVTNKSYCTCKATLLQRIQWGGRKIPNGRAQKPRLTDSEPPALRAKVELLGEAFAGKMGLRCVLNFALWHRQQSH